MKKIFSKEIFFLPLLLLTLFVSVNKVNADENTAYVNDFYQFYGDYSTLDTSIVSNLITYWQTNLSTNYPYYIIRFSGNNVSSSCEDNTNFNCRQRLVLYATTSKELYYYNIGQSSPNTGFNFNAGTSTTYCYNFFDSTYATSPCDLSYGNNFLPYTSNVSYTFANSNHCAATSHCADEVVLPLYSNLDLGVSLPQYKLLQGYVLPTYTTLSSNTYIPNPSDPSSGGSGLHISDIFTNPIQALESVWASIVNIFNLIGEFIALIPSPLREFLISAFMLAIILGLLKILL